MIQGMCSIAGLQSHRPEDVDCCRIVNFDVDEANL